MASKQATVDYIVDQVSNAGFITSRKMFGEYALYCDTKVVALICDDQLFVKPTNAGRNFIENVEEAPAYPGSKMYFLIDGDKWDDRDWMTELIKQTADELPLPKPKKKKK
jgi:DNA transformation protein